MRIASSPTLRIASGLLLAVLLSVVGYQVVRRLNSHGPDALLKRADEISWVDNWIQTERFDQQAKSQYVSKPSALNGSFRESEPGAGAYR